MINPLLTPPEPFAALIFDCDGTLANNLPAHYQAWSETLHEYGIEMTFERFHAITGMSTADIILSLNKEFDCQLSVKALSEAQETRYTRLISKVTDVRPVVDLARQYRGKVPLAVASGSGRFHVYSTLEHLGLYDLFDAIVTSDDVPNNKPFPDILLTAASRLNVSPAGCVMYEDSNSGIEAAERAGMRVVDIRVLFFQDPLARYRWPDIQ